MKSLADPKTRLEIGSRIANVKPDSPRQWGRMTAHGMICHLADSFRGPMGDRFISPATGLFQRTVMKWGALYFPMPWPKELPTRPEVDQAQGGTKPADFTRDRAELIALMQRFVDPARDSSRDTHPIFGRMSRNQWLRWAYLHMDHHLRQFGC